MSLINDALKKAQKQRTGEVPSLASMPSVGGETPHRIAKRAKPASFDSLVIRAVAGAGILLVVVVGGYFAFRSDSQEKHLAVSTQPAVSVQPAQPVAAPVLSPPPSTPLPAASTSVPIPAPAFNLPVAPKPEPVAAVQRTENREPRTAEPSPVPRPPSAEPAKPAPVLTGSDPRVSPFRAQTPPPSPAPVSTATAPAPEPARPAARLEPRAIQFIENIKVAGIMARPTDSKVLMNDRVYRIGSLVEAEMGLTLVGITSNSLTFEDGTGARYTRTF